VAADRRGHVPQGSVTVLAGRERLLPLARFELVRPALDALERHAGCGHRRGAVRGSLEAFAHRVAQVWVAGLDGQQAVALLADARAGPVERVEVDRARCAVVDA